MVGGVIINTFHHNNKQWRQKWEQMVKGEKSAQNFHTWHETEEDTLDFIAKYLKKFGRQLPGNYFRPLGQPTFQVNKNNEPIGEYLLTSEHAPTFV